MNILKCPWLRCWHLFIFLIFWSFYNPPALAWFCATCSLFCATCSFVLSNFGLVLCHLPAVFPFFCHVEMFPLSSSLLYTKPEHFLFLLLFSNRDPNPRSLRFGIGDQRGTFPPPYYNFYLVEPWNDKHIFFLPWVSFSFFS